VNDRNSEVTSSRIAAGLITPITGQKLVQTWRFPQLWPLAQQFYGRVERETNQSFLRRTAMVRILENDREAAIFDRRRSSGEYPGLPLSASPDLNKEWYQSRHGAFEMCDGGQLNVPLFLDSSRQAFERQGGYRACDLDVPREIVLDTEGVLIPHLGVAARQIVFCQGSDVAGNYWFRDVAFKPAKGEILTLRIPQLREQRIIHHGVWLAPWVDGLYKCGSTYDWKQLDSLPTAHGRGQILDRLNDFLMLPVEVVAHQAAVRPIHRNQFPVMGRHPAFPQLAIFNGLGSKGSLQAPYFAQMLASYLGSSGTIEPAVDVQRKTAWTSLTSRAKSLGDPAVDLAFHVKRTSRRSLTDQAQEAIRAAVSVGDRVVDGTAGNGHDTHFLAQLVGPNGMVYAFDIQAVALERTRIRLIENGLTNTTLLHHDHSELETRLPPEARGGISAGMFNLGYLPGGDKSVTTQTESTLRGIMAALDFLRPSGLVSVLAYPGHERGSVETRAIRDFVECLSPAEFQVTTIEGEAGRSASPVLFLVKRSGMAGEKK
jgi:glycine oxidase